MSSVNNWLQLLHKKYFKKPTDHQWFINNCRVQLIFSKFACRVTVQEVNGNLKYFAPKKCEELEKFIEDNKNEIEEKLR